MKLYVVQVFVGLGFPYEGPAPLEAIANGAAFLNPKVSLCIFIHQLDNDKIDDKDDRTLEHIKSCN